MYCSPGTLGQARRTVGGQNWLSIPSAIGCVGDQVTLLRGKGGVHGEFTGLSLVIGHLDDPIALKGRNVVTLAQHDLPGACSGLMLLRT